MRILIAILVSSLVMFLSGFAWEADPNGVSLQLCLDLEGGDHVCEVLLMSFDTGGYRFDQPAQGQFAVQQYYNGAWHLTTQGTVVLNITKVEPKPPCPKCPQYEDHGDGGQ